jgi:hypothetical protein
MTILTGQSCWALVAQVFLMYFNCVQRWQDFVTAMSVGCGPTASPSIGKRLGSPPREPQAKTSHLKSDEGPCIAKWYYFGFASAMFLNSNTSLSMYLFCNSRIYIITLYSGHVCVYYALIFQCWHLIWILIRTNHPCLGVGCHSHKLLFSGKTEG